MGGYGDGFMACFAVLHGCFAFEQLTEEFHDLTFLFHAHHKVNAWEGGNFASFQLGVASHHDKQGSWMLTGEAVDGLTALVVGYVGHRTGVDDTDICLFA